jgi:hypothetical protein
MPAYTTVNSYSKDSIFKSWTQIRIDLPDFMDLSFLMKMKGAGQITQFSYKLGLNGDKYLADLSSGVSFNPMSDTTLSDDAIAMSGPIKEGANIVSYLDLMGNDSVVVRDADKHVVGLTK